MTREYSEKKGLLNYLGKNKTVRKVITGAAILTGLSGVGCSGGLSMKSGENIFSYSLRRAGMPAAIGEIGTYNPSFWSLPDQPDTRMSNNIEDYLDTKKNNIWAYVEGTNGSERNRKTLALLFDPKDDIKLHLRTNPSDRKGEWINLFLMDKKTLEGYVRKMMQENSYLKENSMGAITEIDICKTNPEGWRPKFLGYVFSPYHINVKKIKVPETEDFYFVNKIDKKKGPITDGPGAAPSGAGVSGGVPGGVSGGAGGTTGGAGSSGGDGV